MPQGKSGPQIQGGYFVSPIWSPDDPFGSSYTLPKVSNTKTDLRDAHAMAYYFAISNPPTSGSLPRPYHLLEDCHVGWLLDKSPIPKANFRDFWPGDFDASGEPHTHRIQFGRPYPIQDEDGNWFAASWKTYPLCGSQGLYDAFQRDNIDWQTTLSTSWTDNKPRPWTFGMEALKGSKTKTLEVDRRFPIQWDRLHLPTIVDNDYLTTEFVDHLHGDDHVIPLIAGTIFESPEFKRDRRERCRFEVKANTGKDLQSKDLTTTRPEDYADPQKVNPIFAFRVPTQAMGQSSQIFPVGEILYTDVKSLMAERRKSIAESVKSASTTKTPRQKKAQVTGAASTDDGVDENEEEQGSSKGNETKTELPKGIIIQGDRVTNGVGSSGTLKQQIMQYALKHDTAWAYAHGWKSGNAKAIHKGQYDDSPSEDAKIRKQQSLKTKLVEPDFGSTGSKAGSKQPGGEATHPAAAGSRALSPISTHPHPPNSKDQVPNPVSSPRPSNTSSPGMDFTKASLAAFAKGAKSDKPNEPSPTQRNQDSFQDQQQQSAMAVESNDKLEKPSTTQQLDQVQIQDRQEQNVMTAESNGKQPADQSDQGPTKAPPHQTSESTHSDPTRNKVELERGDESIPPDSDSSEEEFEPEEPPKEPESKRIQTNDEILAASMRATMKAGTTGFGTHLATSVALYLLGDDLNTLLEQDKTSENLTIPRETLLSLVNRTLTFAGTSFSQAKNAKCQVMNAILSIAANGDLDGRFPQGMPALPGTTYSEIETATNLPHEARACDAWRSTMTDLNNMHAKDRKTQLVNWADPPMTLPELPADLLSRNHELRKSLESTLANALPPASSLKREKPGGDPKHFGSIFRLPPPPKKSEKSHKHSSGQTGASSSQNPGPSTVQDRSSKGNEQANPQPKTPDIQSKYHAHSAANTALQEPRSHASSSDPDRKKARKNYPAALRRRDGES